MNKEIRCPYCGDTWTYRFAIDHEDGKAVVTDDFNIIEEWQECTCYKCYGKYRLLLDNVTHKMFSFVYRAWRSVKGK